MYSSSSLKKAQENLLQDVLVNCIGIKSGVIIALFLSLEGCSVFEQGQMFFGKQGLCLSGMELIKWLPVGCSLVSLLVIWL